MIQTISKAEELLAGGVGLVHGMLDEKDGKKRGLDQEVEEAAVRAGQGQCECCICTLLETVQQVACRMGLKLLDFHASAILSRQSPIHVLAKIFLA